jgi:hypothetical protein
MSLWITLLLVAVGAVVALLVVAGVMVRRNPEAARRRVEALFRRAPRPPRAPGQDHYYRPYWS